MSNIEYVIYCRKSSDESSGNQKQSIPDQIRACIKYAERENLTIRNKPADFSIFEKETDLEKEDNEEDIQNRRTFQETRGLYIIKEQESAKVPKKRKKWNELIKLVSKQKNNGIISYSPDRQARNMLEGGQLIDLVDRNKLPEYKNHGKVSLDLKYPNFQFQDNAAGKMMLGIWFVFSKQYSDKLGEDIGRGTDSKVISGKSVGRYKPGYFSNENKYHEPDPKHFPLIQEAFRMKLDGEVESEILAYLHANGYVRTIKNSGRKSKMSRTRLNEMFQDEFYYGIFINGNSSTDLRVSNPVYKPIITDDQYDILESRRLKHPNAVAKTKTKDVYEEIKSFTNSFIISEDDYHFTFSLPNRGRFNKKIETANKKGVKLGLKDVVGAHQICYDCKNKSSKSLNLRVTQADIDAEIIDKLGRFHVGEEAYKEALSFTQNQLDKIILNGKEQRGKKRAEITRLESKKDIYIRKNMGGDKDKDEKRIYNSAKKNFEINIKRLNKELENLRDNERDEVLELEIFLEVLNKAKEYYIDASYVQKGKIAQLLFSNIKITHKKRLEIQVKPAFQTLFNPIWWS